MSRERVTTCSRAWAIKSRCLLCACRAPPGRRFDDVFDELVDNSQLYEQAVQPLVGTIFR